MYHPFSKLRQPNPGTDGTGIIDSVTYENISIKNAMWWAIWVSTQQQKQPHGADTGCSFLFPLFNSTCPTQPLVPVTNLVLRNVTSTGSWLSPGVLRCDPAGPCTGWRFENVQMSSASDFPDGKNYLCQAIENITYINSHPKSC